MIWLTEFHRRWQNSRGKRLTPANRAFSQDWPKLLNAAGINRAEDVATAVREAEALEKSGNLLLKRHRYRNYLIERISLPLERETWLIGRFGGIAVMDLRSEVLKLLDVYCRRGHARFPREWLAMLAALEAAFKDGRSLRPFHWNQPGPLALLLEIVARLSETDWPTGTLIRSASVEIGQDSKWLEGHRRTCESGLALLLGEEITLLSLGLVEGDASVELGGPVCLHFPDGSSHDFDGLTHPILSASDLRRCVSISTTAERLLTIENRKTTFRQYIAANNDRRTLIAASSFPTPAFRDFLSKLPPDLPHFHFGDTDPSGWHILLKLREAAQGPVIPFRMNWRPAGMPIPLMEHDTKLLPSLIANPLLSDLRIPLENMIASNDRGDFEQETLPPPMTGGWPFGGDFC